MRPSFVRLLVTTAAPALPYALSIKRLYRLCTLTKADSRPHEPVRFVRNAQSTSVATRAQACDYERLRTTRTYLQSNQPVAAASALRSARARRRRRLFRRAS